MFNRTFPALTCTFMCGFSMLFINIINFALNTWKKKSLHKTIDARMTPQL